MGCFKSSMGYKLTFQSAAAGDEGRVLLHFLTSTPKLKSLLQLHKLNPCVRA